MKRFKKKKKEKKNPKKQRKPSRPIRIDRMITIVPRTLLLFFFRHFGRERLTNSNRMYGRHKRTRAFALTRVRSHCSDRLTNALFDEAVAFVHRSQPIMPIREIPHGVVVQRRDNGNGLFKRRTKTLQQ